MERPAKVTVKVAAKLMRKSELYVRECMRRGLLPIGVATQMPGADRWNFYISPTRLAEVTGLSVSEIMKAARETEAEQCQSQT